MITILPFYNTAPHRHLGTPSVRVKSDAALITGDSSTKIHIGMVVSFYSMVLTQ